jgi:hypothetical protein
MPAAHAALSGLLERIGAEFGLTLADLRSGPPTRRVLVQARSVVCEPASRELGMSWRQSAKGAGRAESTVSRAVLVAITPPWLARLQPADPGAGAAQS